jgi:hypothetical protein
MSAQVINSQPLEIQPDRQAGVRDYGRDAVMDMVYFTARNNYERQVMRHFAETRQDIPFELDVRLPTSRGPLSADRRLTATDSRDR